MTFILCMRSSDYVLMYHWLGHNSLIVLLLLLFAVVINTNIDREVSFHYSYGICLCSYFVIFVFADKKFSSKKKEYERKVKKIKFIFIMFQNFSSFDEISPWKRESLERTFVNLRKQNKFGKDFVEKNLLNACKFLINFN